MLTKEKNNEHEMIETEGLRGSLLRSRQGFTKIEAQLSTSSNLKRKRATLLLSSSTQKQFFFIYRKHTIQTGGMEFFKLSKGWAWEDISLHTSQTSSPREP